MSSRKRFYPPATARALFRNPPSIFRGAPFWSWNNRLNLPQLLRQIDQFKQMGFGGVHIHARTGLDTEYLSREFMQAVQKSAQRLKKRGMLCWLYDEDRWPSGFAGGLVTTDPQHREKRLLWTTQRDDSRGEPLASHEIRLIDGRLQSYRRIDSRDGSRPPAIIRHAYLVTAPPDSWHNNQTYVDTFSRRAIGRFIQVTHERYFGAVGHHFGKLIPAIFTDEPHFTKKQTLRHRDDPRDVVLPFTDDFPATFRAAYGFDLLDHLPELFWDRADAAPSRPRYCFHDHTAERFAQAFGDTIGRWCGRHGIALTGHMLSEATLFGQTRAVGEVMRAMRSFQIPGIDILTDNLELTTAKQAQSLARQLDRPGVLSELYGVTNWDFDFAGHKRQGDWQAACGITVRVPHLAWVSMAGESKRDYPAAIGYQSPWFKEYSLIEDHFARVNVLMTRGRANVRVGVIHPIESFWLLFGGHNARAAEQREAQFKDLAAWLSFGLLDFDYLSEALLAAPARPAADVAAYDVILVPALTTMRPTTLAALERFADAGGTVVFAGEIPSLIDAQPSDQARLLAERCVRVGFSQREILDALEPFRDVEIRKADGSPADTLLHQMRIDGRQRHLFICNYDRGIPANRAEIRVRGRWDAALCDTFTGKSTPIPAQAQADRTTIRLDIAAHGHALLTLSPATRRVVKPRPEKQLREISRLAGPVKVTLSEPNVLLLDQAEWRIDDGRWHPREEVLRLDNLARKQLGLPMRGGQMAQPWTDRSPTPVLGHLTLRFRFESEVGVRRPLLALENAATAKLVLNGKAVGAKPAGWWVDEAIRTVALPPIKPGRQDLLITLPLTRKTDVEWCYLLGDFGVRVQGRDARLIDPVRRLDFGDWTHQGLPFYAGNVTYHCQLAVGGADVAVEAPHFRNPLLSVAVDGKPAGRIAFAPYRLALKGLKSGRRRLDVTAYGNRINAFGPVHHTNEQIRWVGPAAWRSEGPWWSYEYNLKKMGILAAPIVLG